MADTICLRNSQCPLLSICILHHPQKLSYFSNVRFIPLCFQNKHLRRSYSPGQTDYRIQKEMINFLNDPPANCELEVNPKNIRIWIITMKGVQNTIYENEVFKLKVIFPSEYPLKPPIVFFLQPCPRHCHVYSNGDICMSLLGTDWTPSLTISSISTAILSMLSEAKVKSLPVDNAAHADSRPGMRHSVYMYHDDKC